MQERLVEMDERNVRMARTIARATGLSGVEVVQGDASLTDIYAATTPMLHFLWL